MRYDIWNVDTFWVRKHAQQRRFSGISNLYNYYRKFVTQTEYLLGKAEILVRGVNLLFFQGIEYWQTCVTGSSINFQSRTSASRIPTIGLD